MACIASSAVVIWPLSYAADKFLASSNSVNASVIGESLLPDCWVATSSNSSLANTTAALILPAAVAIAPKAVSTLLSTWVTASASWVTAESTFVFNSSHTAWVSLSSVLIAVKAVVILLAWVGYSVAHATPLIVVVGEV